MMRAGADEGAARFARRPSRLVRGGAHAPGWGDGMKNVEVRNVSRGTLLLPRGLLAISWESRLVGLMGRKALAPDEGLVIRPCESIHTMWMRFPIDVVFVDVRNTAVRAFPNVAPFRLRFGGWDAHAVIEGPVGMIQRSGTRVGDGIEIREGEG
ncbi:MAG: DUF192 domain-containing protein [Candidatus Eisenbacteria bacterium]